MALMNQNQEYSTFGRHVGYIIIVNIAVLLLGLIQVPILTKGLGTTLYGTWSLIMVTISLIVPFAMLSFSMSVVRFLSAEKDIRIVREDFYSACTIVFTSGTIFSALLFFSSDYLAVSIFKDADVSSYIRLASVLVLINSMHTVILAFFRMRRWIGLYSILNLLTAVFRVGLIAAAILLGHKLNGVIIVVIINGALFSLFPLLIIFRQAGFQPPRFSHMKSYLKWGIPLTPNSAMLWIMSVSDRYMVSYFLGVSSAGVYSAAYAIGNYASFALMSLGIVLYPTISKAYDEGKRDETAKYLKYSVKYLMMIAIPSAFGLSILAKPLLQILTTSEFVPGYVIIPYVSSGAVLFCFYQTCVYIIHLVGKTHITVRLLGTAAALNIGLNLILIPRMGIVGAAIATLIAYGVLGILTLMVSRRYLKFDLSLFFILKSAIASAIMALCIYLFDPSSGTEVIISIVGGILIYFGVLLIIKGLSKSEIRFFLNFVRENLRRILWRDKQ
jgi:O-antigen/teichoic acid export membrane protein